MLEMIDEIRQLLPDVPWVFEPSDDFDFELSWLPGVPYTDIRSWLEATHCRLNRMTYDQ